MIVVCSTSEAVARVAAERFVDLAERNPQGLRVALSGGVTPAHLYRLLAREPLRERIDWPRVVVLFADERAVPPDHPESNYGMVRRLLLDALGDRAPEVRRMHAESADLDRAAREYETHLTQPIDLLLLGVGPDGHTASIFPHAPVVGEMVRRAAAVTDSPKPPAGRLTITPRVLAEARTVLVLATGDDKADAVARAIEADVEPAACPARLVRDRTWIVDRAAASRLVNRKVAVG